MNHSFSRSLAIFRFGLLILLSPCLLAFTSIAHSKPGKEAAHYSTGPEPSWVVSPKLEQSPTLTRSAMHYELVDNQIKVNGANADRYYHVIRVVAELAGLGQAAQIEAASFDPQYQSLTIHRLRIERAGHFINKLPGSSIKLLQREPNLESQMYDGRMTASIVLNDVRVGDRIEYSYTISGSNPVFNGKYFDTILLPNARGPVALYQVRVVAQQNRNIHFRAAPNIKVTSQIKNGQRETIFRRGGIPQVQFDETAPPGAFIPDLIQLSEFADWNDVARWGEQLFDPPIATPSSVKAEADKIRAIAVTPEDKLLAVLDFVQKQIRYFGTEVGPYSHRPASPSKVMEQRYGDCKDKVALLIELLRELGIPADPVLVSVSYLDDVAAVLPSADPFNHVIARVNLNGKTYWIDGTRNFQSGPLAQRQSQGFILGLVLRSSERDLTRLPDASAERRIDVSEHFTITDFADDPLLEERITFYEGFAEGTRNRIASGPLEQIETEFTSALARHYPSITRIGPTTIEESKTDNAITIVMQFKVPEFWKYPQQNRLAAQLTFWNPMEAMRLPNDPGRKLPFRIQSPGIYHQTITLDFPEDTITAPNNSQYDDGTVFYKYHVDYRMTPRTFTFEARLQLLKNKVGISEWPTYIDKVSKLWPSFGAYSFVPAITLPLAEQAKADAKLLQKAMDRRETKAITPVQRNARFRILAMTAHINSGRLKPKFRANALRDRGTQYDYVGLYAEAQRDVEESIRLAPDIAENYGAAAENAAMRGDDVKAIEYANKQLELDPSSDGGHSIKARSYVNLGNYQAAKQEWIKTLESSAEVERSYATIMLYFTARHLSEDPIAVTKPHMPVGSAPEWPYKVLQYLTGTGDLDSVIANAKENKQDPSRLCELYYFLGEKSLLDGDVRRARDYFNQSIATGVTEFVEYGLAKHAIERLNVAKN